MMPARRIFAEKRRYIYPLVGVLLLNIALLVAVVVPLSKKVQGGAQAAQQAAVALAAAKKDHAAARATVTGKAAADEELKKFYDAVLPANLSRAREITFLKISGLAEKAHLVVGNRKQKPTQDRDSTLGKLTVEQTLIGEYADLRKFIYDLETTPEFLILENIALSSQGGDADGELRMDVRISTYYRAGSNDH
jgi:Tfp pilus assembly protein PilO